MAFDFPSPEWAAAYKDAINASSGAQDGGGGTGPTGASPSS